MAEFTLRPIVESDINTCAHIAGLSFESDRHTQLKARSPTNPYNHEEGMKSGLSHWLNRPPGAVEMTLATDNATGETIGWVVWGFRGFNSAAAEAQREEELKQKEPVSKEPSQELVTKPAQGSSTREKLENHTGSDMTAWMKRLMPPGSKCMFICSIVVHPAHQNRGVGSALIRKGTHRADAEGVYCWVHASEAGSGMFEKQGFQEVGRLELDLDEWNIGKVTPPEGPDVKWGKYTFRYMRREAH